MLTPLDDTQTVTVLVDAINARSRRLQTVFSGSFVTDAALGAVDQLTREIDEACRVLRQEVRKRVARVA